MTEFTSPELSREVFMRSLIIALIAALVIIAAGSFKGEAAEECMIGDAALCLSDPNCHWDGSRRGCFPGPAPKQDVCVVHEDKAVCGTSSLGCQWSDGTNKCESKAE
jgi:hypothetical protein